MALQETQTPPLSVQVVVVATSIQALAALGKSLKKDFSVYARNSTSTLFDKFQTQALNPEPETPEGARTRLKLIWPIL